MTTVGILHPGQMGASLAAAATARATVLWAGDDRSAATAARATAAGARDVGPLPAVLDAADIVVSICPPAAAESLAEEVAGHGFSGLYVDANAVSPATARRIGQRFERFVDGGVIGPPAHKAGTTRCYLSGPEAATVAAIWTDSVLEAQVLAVDDPASAGAASALKMAYAGWTKGQSALLLAVNSLADQAGVGDALRAEWDRSQPDLRKRSDWVATAVGPKAWRFEGEMAEIAATMAATGLPDGFHRGAEDLYRKLAGFKDHPGPTLDELLQALAGPVDSDVDRG